MEGAAGRRRRGQATLEFAVAAPLFFLCLLGAVDAGLWAVETTAQVSAVEAAARTAASAGSSALAQTAPDARAVTAAVAGRLNPALFATRLVPWCGPGPSCRPASCPTPQQVEAQDGPRSVAVCVVEHDPPACTAATAPYCHDSPTTTVRITGFVAALVPPGFGPGELGGELPTDIVVTTHTLRFAP